MSDHEGIEIDLRGPRGNAFFLLGTAQKISKQIGNSSSYTEDLLKEMQSGDYQYLLSVFEKEFPMFTIIGKETDG